MLGSTAVPAVDMIDGEEGCDRPNFCAEQERREAAARTRIAAITKLTHVHCADACCAGGQCEDHEVATPDVEPPAQPISANNDEDGNKRDLDDGEDNAAAMVQMRARFLEQLRPTAEGSTRQTASRAAPSRLSEGEDRVPTLERPEDVSMVGSPSLSSTGEPSFYTPPGTLTAVDTLERRDHENRLDAPNNGDSVSALLAWLDEGAPVPQQRAVALQPLNALKHTKWRQPYAREVRLTSSTISTYVPSCTPGKATNVWSLDDLIGVQLQRRGDQGSVLWLTLPGALFPRPRMRTTLEIRTASEAMAIDLARQLGF